MGKRALGYARSASGIQLARAPLAALSSPEKYVSVPACSAVVHYSRAFQKLPCSPATKAVQLAGIRCGSVLMWVRFVGAPATTAGTLPTPNASYNGSNAATPNASNVCNIWCCSVWASRAVKKLGLALQGSPGFANLEKRKRKCRSIIFCLQSRLSWKRFALHISKRDEVHYDNLGSLCKISLMLFTVFLFSRFRLLFLALHLSSLVQLCGCGCADHCWVCYVMCGRLKKKI